MGKLTIAQCCHGAVGVAKSVLNIGLAHPDEIARRRHICPTCPHSTKRVNPKTGVTEAKWCQLCHCLIYHKSRRKDEICLDGRW